MARWVYKTTETIKAKIFNKTFYKFLFSFIAVIASTLLLILALGISGEIQ